MKKILLQLFEHKTLSRESARQVLLEMSRNAFNEHEITAFMTVYLMRTITIEELQGFRDALLELCIRVDLDDLAPIDIVGTGGDGKNTFNISTLACFVVAGAGQKVAKQGNYGATTISGASNVMELLGYNFSNDPAQLRRETEEAGICFMHAPMFHPAMKTVAPIRKNLGIRTFFNMLGPLINPAQPPFQLIGTFNLEMARIYCYLLQQQGSRFAIVNSLDGYDEISLTADAKVITQEGISVRTPLELGKKMVMPEDIGGGNSQDAAARIFKKILRGEGSLSQNAVVLANAALALFTTGKFGDYEEAYHAAVQSLDSGAAQECLDKLIALQS